MIKYTHLLKIYLLLILFLVISASSLNAQYLIRGTQKVNYQNDSVILIIDNVRGNIQWEASKDKTVWDSIVGANNDTLRFRVDSSAYYRARIKEGTCDPIYSDTVFVVQLLDERDNQIYDAAKIGNQWWMADNLRFRTTTGSWYYNDDSISFSQYGRLYNWETAKKSCPAGWHLPSDYEWKILENTLGIDPGSLDNTGWRGTNEAYMLFNNGPAGFDVLFGGMRYPGEYYGEEGMIATFWTSEPSDMDNAWYRGLNIEHGDIHRDSYSKDYGYSVRCLRNSEPYFIFDSIGFISDTSGVAFVSIIYDGGLEITEKGICWGLTPNPDTTGNHKISGSGSDSFILPIFPLAPNTNFFVKAYIKNQEGVKYSSELSFKTEVTLPYVTTSSISSVTTNSADGGGNITAQEGIIVLSRGVCWSTSPEPTIDNDKTTDGSGPGGYISSITGLIPNTKYYLKAYATVEGGVAYGNPISFTTLPLNETGVMVDSRDGRLYNTVRIGNQWWMAENLRYYRSSGSWYYEDDSTTYSNYGRLYDWQTATTSCPSGWHLPYDDEWKTLEATLGMHITDINLVDWRGTNQALALFPGGSTGFNIKFGGFRYPDSTYTSEGSIATFWSSTQYDADHAWYRGFNTSHEDIHRQTYAKGDGYSVRCIKNMSAEVVLDSIGAISEYTGSAHVNIKYDGGSPITERGVCWSTVTTPVYSGNHKSSGTDTGSFSVLIDNLSHSTMYRVRAYTINSEGITYSNEISFNTKVALPTVTTTDISLITSNSASSGGTVTAGGDVTVTGRGICWSTSPLPSIEDNKTTNGTGTGTFSSSISELTPNTKYYVRAYATVAGGVAYGSVMNFTTLPLNETGTLTDSRDGMQYKTVRIGNQWWMAENLRYYKSSGSWYYDYDSATYSQYGRLYTHETAMNSCPSGWHLPTDDEWKTMEVTIGLSPAEVDDIDWRGTNQGMSLYPGGPIGFDILFAGQYYPYGVFGDVGTIATFWSSTAFDASNSWYRGFNLNHGDIHRYSFSNDYGYSVRCLKNTGAEINLDSVGSITEYASTAYANISYDGGTNIIERGVCWSTSPDPVYTGAHISSGTGTGTFIIPISGLEHSTIYYIRSYAINSVGVNYSADYTFTTKVALPVATTSAVTLVTTNSASSGGTVTAGGDITVTGRGVCWNTSPLPTIEDDKTNNGTGTGTFSSSLSSLNPNTEYFVRAYATVTGGVAYGNQFDFKTLPVSETGTFTDARDGREYKTIHMGDQWWMAENLNFNNVSGSWYYEDDSLNYKQYGKLYNFQTAISSCPSGWHLPSDYEWKILEYQIGITDTGSTSEWRGTNEALALFTSGETGFDIEFGGQFTTGFYNSEGTITGFWTSTVESPTNAYYRGFNIGRGDMHRYPYAKDSRFYVRCLQDKAPTVLTADIVSYTDSSVICGGNVIYDGGSPVTDRGICIGTSHNPTISADTTNNGSGMGQFTSYKKGLNAATTYYVRAYATNGKSTSYGAEKSFTTDIGIPKVTTSSVSLVTDSSARCGGNVTSSGGATVTARGVCYGTSPNPAVEVNDKTSNETGTGSFVSVMNNLQPNTTYYVRAYATNSAGTGYGNQYSFITDIGLPKVTTASVSAITETTATGGGEVTYTGGAVVTERGICWSLTQNPTTSDFNYPSGSGSGSFESFMTSLQPNKTYYVRAYATNSEGTGYGGQVSFITSTALPQVTTGSISSIAITTASGGGNVTSDGGSPITVRGVCWSTGISPTIADFTTDDGTGTGPFTSSLTGLTRNTRYYVRAYATNDAALTGYGDTVSFTTDAELPQLSTTAISSLTDSSVWTGGTITNDGGAPIISKGVCWNTSGNPTIADDSTNNGTGTSAFTSYIDGLESFTTYYVRAYAQNSAGYDYGNQIEFKTLYETDSITDARDSQKYLVVKIGTEWWMAENLNYSDTGSVYYNNDSISYADVYGRLYTWTSMMKGAASSIAVPSGVQGVCPSGWHIPSNAEWNNLIADLGGSGVAGSALKETGIDHWQNQNTDATNETGFTARGAGLVDSGLASSELKSSAYFWTTTESDALNGYAKQLTKDDGTVTDVSQPKSNHYSVRCKKN